MASSYSSEATFAPSALREAFLVAAEGLVAGTAGGTALGAPLAEVPAGAAPGNAGAGPTPGVAAAGFASCAIGAGAAAIGALGVEGKGRAAMALEDSPD